MTIMVTRCNDKAREWSGISRVYLGEPLVTLCTVGSWAPVQVMSPDDLGLYFYMRPTCKGEGEGSARRGGSGGSGAAGGGSGLEGESSVAGERQGRRAEATERGGRRPWQLRVAVAATCGTTHARGRRG
jgi:hypothetical protein